MLTSKQRRELLARANRLSAGITVHAGDATAGAIDHVRQALVKHELLKVRVQTDDADECEATGRQLADAIPCEWVGRVGRVVILFQPHDPSDDEQTPGT